MTGTLTPATALDELVAQHTMLRELMARCEDLADEVDAGTQDAGQLVREVARLRAAFDAHNHFEEELLRPLLLDVEWLGAVRVSRMVEDHVAEHRALRLGLRTTPTSELRDVISDLRAHLVGEERYFLSRKVLRDDLST